jgi:YegS/Rv2252/BmrU family lipid kinase
VSRALALLPNRVAGGGKASRVLPEVIAELDRLAADYRVVEASSLEAARSEARASGAAGETVVAIGGDGLVGPVAGALRGSAGALAIVPAGRGNDFARVLGVPSDPREAAVLAAQGAERLLDVAEANGHPYVGIASLGFDSDANRIANDSRVVRGNAVYVYAALRALAGWRPARFEVIVDGERATVSGYSVAIANSKAYGGGMYLVPHADLEDGMLDVLLVGQKSKLAFLRDIPKVFKGTHVDDPAARFMRGTNVEVRADRPFTVYADGDPIAELPLRITVEPRALRVIAPAPAGLAGEV